jgi:hypothetical protein
MNFSKDRRDRGLIRGGFGGPMTLHMALAWVEMGLGMS